MLKYLIFLTHDKTTFFILQSILLFVLLYVIVYSKYRSYHNRKNGLGLVVRRGEKSNSYFHHFAFSFISVVLAVIIGIADTAHGHKVFIFLVDVIIILYISYYNSWSRNKLVGIYSRLEQKKENH